MECVVSNELVLYRLNRSIERLNEEFDLNAPEIIKKVELLHIKELCDSLLIDLN